MSIPTDRLREIADGAMGIGAPLVLTQAEQVAVCTELLACREERDAASERVDLDIDEFRRIKAELDNLRVGLPPLTEDSARSLYAVVAGICDRAVTAGRQRVPLIAQRDKAEAERDTARAALAETEGERDAARAEAEKVRKALIACGRKAGGGLADDVSTDFLMYVPEEVRMRLAAVKRQRDELIAIAGEVVSAISEVVPDEPLDELSPIFQLETKRHHWEYVVDCRDRLEKAIAAEQPKPQQPEVQPFDEGPWMRALAEIVGRVIEGGGVESFSLADLRAVFGSELVAQAMPQGGL